MKLNLAIAAASLGLAAAPVPASADTISITEMDWDAAKVISQVLKQIIEKQLGYSVILKPGNTEDSLVSMDAGDGTFDVFPDIWMPNQKAAWDTYIEERKTVVANDGYDAVQGFYVPASFAAEHGISDISDLNNSKIAALFDSDGNGKGEYWAGEEKWGATRLNQIKMKSYGLDDLWEPWIASNEDAKAALKAAIDEGDGLLFYHWTPEWVFGVYDLARIKEPAYFAGCDKVFTPDERSDWLEASEFACEFEISQVYVFHSASLDVRAPTVSAFLSRVDFDPEVINGWVKETGVEGRSPEEVASDWIAQNPTAVDTWLKGADGN